MYALLFASLAVTWCPAQSAGDVGIGPAPSPRPVAWEMELAYLAPRRIVLNVGGRDEVFWYMLYSVVNTSGSAQPFHPTFELVTEDLRVFTTDSGIPARVFDAIRARHARTHPDLLHPTRAIGDLSAGMDYQRQSVAIWRNADVGPNRFTVYVSGLSGEARLERNPAYDPQRPEESEIEATTPDGRTIRRRVLDNPRMFTIRKTLELRYVLPASEQLRGRVEPQLESERWIMR